MKQWWTENYHYMKSLGMESVSGTGSTLDATRVIRDELPKIIEQFGVKSMLDIPCGDGNWMSQVDLGGILYLGVDIVPDNIRNNINRIMFNTLHTTWMQADITQDILPTVDLIFCRDCLVHFSTDDVWQALHNIVASGSTYLLTTTFTERKENHDIPTGGWRTLSLTISPFHFPEPLYILNEQCAEQDGVYADKSLGLWKIADLRELV